MTTESEAEVVRLEPAQAVIRNHFLGWQCRIRQLAVREAGGRPTSAMTPQVLLEPEGQDHARDLGRIVVLTVKAAPEETTAQFRHMVRKTHDPAERYQAALKLLAAAYYQRPQEFSEELTALFGPGSETATALCTAGRCRLLFEQYQQSYDLPCSVRELAVADPAFQATYWHNALFNPAMPAGARVLGLQPDWARAEADPPAV